MSEESTHPGLSLDTVATREVGHPIEGQITPYNRTLCPLDIHLSSHTFTFRRLSTGNVVVLEIVRGNLGGGGGRVLSGHEVYPSVDHGIGHILTVDSLSSSVIVSSISPLPTQHRMLIAVPIYCKRASSDSSLASMLLLAVHRQQTSLE
jgi:hypothetical protein